LGGGFRVTPPEMVNNGDGDRAQVPEELKSPLPEKKEKKRPRESSRTQQIQKKKKKKGKKGKRPDLKKIKREKPSGDPKPGDIVVSNRPRLWVKKD